MRKPLPLTTQNEADMLCKYMNASKGSFVELGTRWGGTSLWIAERFPERDIVSIDIKKQHEDTTFANFPNVTFIEADAGLLPTFAVSSIGLLFIDAEHKVGAVQRQIIVWSLYVEPGGFVVIHDAVKQEEPTLTSIGGVLLVHKNAEGELESGYEEIGEVAKNVLSNGWTLINKVDSSLVFQKGGGLL